MKKIVIVSNPFGFGPSSKANSVIRELLNREMQDLEIYYLGSSFSQEIIGDQINIKKIKVDERSEIALREALVSLGDIDLCVSFQNRFIIKVVKDLKITSFFIDGLAWLWKAIPEDHLSADVIYWTKHPLLMHELGEYESYNIRIIDNFLLQKQNFDSEERIIVNLGGCLNPLRNGLQVNYLNFIINILNRVNFESKSVYLVAGTAACDYLSQRIINRQIQVKNLPHSEVINLINKNSIVIGTGGLNSSIESIYLSSGIIFIVPSNLSQIQTQGSFVKISKNIFHRTWNELLSIKVDYSTSEKDALDFIDDISAKASDLIIQKYADDISQEIKRINFQQQDYSEVKKHLGRNGSIQLVNDIISYIY